MNEEKIPVGVIPRRIWIQLRINDLAGAIERYSKAGLAIPEEWITEYNYWVASGFKEKNDISH